MRHPVLSDVKKRGIFFQTLWAFPKYTSFTMLTEMSKTTLRIKRSRLKLLKKSHKLMYIHIACRMGVQKEEKRETKIEKGCGCVCVCDGER